MDPDPDFSDPDPDFSDPDPDFFPIWIRIFSLSGSGFFPYLDPDFFPIL